MDPAAVKLLQGDIQSKHATWSSLKVISYHPKTKVNSERQWEEALLTKAPFLSSQVRQQKDTHDSLK